MVRFAVLGCGRIGRMHARNIVGNARATLALCYDVSAVAASGMAEELGCKVAASTEAILGDPGIDAIFVASSTATHVDLIEAGVKAKKAVFSEKPVDLDIRRADACWKEIAALSPLVLIGFNRRFDPEFRALKARVDVGAIGKVEQVVITNRDPAMPPPGYARSSGGLFRDFTMHDFDMARYLCGEIAEVTAIGGILVDPAIADEGDIDSAMVLLRAANGALIHINNSRRCVYGYDQRIEVFGERGLLQAGNRHLTTVEQWTANGTRTLDPIQPNFQARYDQSYKAELDHFIDCVIDRRQPLSGFAEGREALRLADAAVESMASGTTVRL